jgi:hypothetical protein
VTLHSTPNMQRIVQGLIADERITLSLYDYARSQGYSDAEIIGARERVRMSQASLEVQGAPHKYKYAPAAQNPGDPTPERQAKAGNYLASNVTGKGDAAPVRRYRLRSVMEIHGDKFEMEHRTTFSAFVGDADLHQRIRVADLNSSGGGGGARLGGLGNVPDHIRDRHNRYEWVVARLTRLEKEVCDVLVTHCISKRDGTPFSTEEYGALCYPMLADKNFHRGAAVNAFRHLVDHLVELMHSPMCPRVRRSQSDYDVIATYHTDEVR